MQATALDAFIWSVSLLVLLLHTHQAVAVDFRIEGTLEQLTVLQDLTEVFTGPVPSARGDNSSYAVGVWQWFGGSVAIEPTQFSALPAAVSGWLLGSAFNSSVDVLEWVSERVYRVRWTQDVPSVTYLSEDFVCALVRLTSRVPLLCVSHGMGPVLVANVTFGPPVPDQAVPGLTVRVDTPAPAFVGDVVSMGLERWWLQQQAEQEMGELLRVYDTRRARAQVAVGFMYLFIVLAVLCVLLVAAVWQGWVKWATCLCPSTPSHRWSKVPQLYFVGAFFALFLALTILVSALTGIIGLIGVCVYFVLHAVALNLSYCCCRFRFRGSSDASHNRMSTASNASSDMRVSAAGHAELAVAMGTLDGADHIEHQRPSTHTNARFHGGKDDPALARAPQWGECPEQLGVHQRKWLGMTVLVLLFAVVVCAAIFALFAVDTYYLWSRPDQSIVAEFVPQSVAKGIVVAYIFDKQASQLKFDTAFFQVSTRVCGDLYTEDLGEGEKYKQIYLDFIFRYGIDMRLFARPSYTQYVSVNDWFTRHLAPGVRPLSNPNDESVVVSPADARINIFPNLPVDSLVWIKGNGFTAQELIGPGWDPIWAQGSMALVRLAPQDYHRYHSPVNATITAQYAIEGPYYSVGVDAMRSQNYAIYNQRSVSVLHSERFGKIAYVAIGATCVGSVVFTSGVGDVVARGAEMGYFQFGGSTLAIVFEPNRVDWDDDIVAHSARGVETYLHVRNRLGALR